MGANAHPPKTLGVAGRVSIAREAITFGAPLVLDAIASLCLALHGVSIAREAITFGAPLVLDAIASLCLALHGRDSRLRVQGSVS